MAADSQHVIFSNEYDKTKNQITSKKQYSVFAQTLSLLGLNSF